MFIGVLAFSGCNLSKSFPHSVSSQHPEFSYITYKPILGPFRKYEQNPLLEPTEEGWESMNVFNPTVTIKDGIFYMFYRAEDQDQDKFKYYRSEIGMATSKDGRLWTRWQDTPILPATETYELPGGNEDPRLFKYDDTYYLWYSGYYRNSKGGMTVEQCAATSEDLIHWTKQGPRGYKNDTIVVNPSNEAVKIEGRFMLYNEKHIAYSSDLNHWDYKPVNLKNKIAGFLELCAAITDIPGHEHFIVLLAAVRPQHAFRNLIDEVAVCKQSYERNQVNHANHYVIVEVLLSKEDPETILGISHPILYPTEPYEMEGLLGPGIPFPVVFVNAGLMLHNNQWMLYYGGADHVICLATAEQPN